MKHYTLDDFACKCGCGTNLIDAAFAQKIDDLAEAAGFTPPINSGYRCPKHNEDVAHTGPTGPHTTGHAADLGCDRGNAFRLLTSAIKAGVFTGVGVQQRGTGRYIHFDDLPAADGQPRPTIWSY